MRKALFLAAGLGACLIAAAPASAAIMIATFTGKVYSGTDDANLFGLGAGADLAGQDFTATFRYDSEAGEDGSEPPYYEERDGGTSWYSGAPSPILDAVLTINGIDLHNAGQDYGHIVSSYSQSLAQAEDYAADGTFLRFQFYLNYATAPGDLSAPVPTTAATGGGLFQYGLSRMALPPTSLTITEAPSSAVPEPASWAMMVAGFGLAGWGMRRPRRRVAAAR